MWAGKASPLKERRVEGRDFELNPHFICLMTNDQMNIHYAKVMVS